MIKYIGSKRRLITRIMAIIAGIENTRSVIDLFSGTSRVGHALKRAGYRVLSNDHNTYAHCLATCYVGADLEDLKTQAEGLIAEFQVLPPAPGYFTETFCEQARFFQPKNGAKVDAIREAIASKNLPPELEAVLLVSLMEAADRVDSTTGVQMAYLKSWAPRAHRELELRLPDLLPRAAHGKGEAHRLEATLAAAKLRADVVYIDPPYNQHSYLGNYHIWETLVRWDKPEAYGRARKRVDCRERQSPFNSKRRCAQAFADLFAAVDAPTLVVSFNNEGFLGRDDLMQLLAPWGEAAVIEVDYRRYVGAQIGIYSPKGAKVGAVSHLRNKELIFIAGKGAKAAAKLAKLEA